MKNIHIIPTDKPSRLYENVDGDLQLGYDFIVRQGMLQNQHIYITSDEEIKEGDWMYYKHFGEDIICKYDTLGGQNTNVNEHKDYYKKIILTTDQNLIKDGVQDIPDEFLEWFVKNPSCEYVEVLYDYFQVDQNNPVLRGSTSLVKQHKIIIPKEEPLTKLQIAKNIAAIGIGKKESKQIKCYCGHTTYCDCGPLEEPKQETLEEAAFNYSKNKVNKNKSLLDFTKGAKWQQEQDKNKYSEEDMKEAFNNGRDMLSWSDVGVEMKYNTFNDWFEQFKKK